MREESTPINPSDAVEGPTYGTAAEANRQVTKWLRERGLIANPHDAHDAVMSGRAPRRKKAGNRGK